MISLTAASVIPLLSLGLLVNASMDPKTDIGNLATCTTCSFSEDNSNYWTAVMYFKARNGSYKRVGQYPNALLGSLKGGMTVYYLSASWNPFLLDHGLLTTPDTTVNRTSTRTARPRLPRSSR